MSYSCSLPFHLPHHGLFMGLRPSQLDFLHSCFASCSRLSESHHVLGAEEHDYLIQRFQELPLGSLMEAKQSTADCLAGSNGRRHFLKKTENGILQADVNLEVSILFTMSQLK